MPKTWDDFVDAVKDFFKSNSGEALIYVLIGLGGSMMPVWGGLMLYKIFSLNPDFWAFVDKGQFYLISAALFTPSCYQLYKNKNSTNQFHSFVFLISIFLLVGSAILFAGATVFDLPVQVFGKSEEPGVNTLIPLAINLPFLRASSVILLLLSIVTAFISQSIDNKVNSGGPEMTDVSDARSEDVKDLNSSFDKRV
jgi:hypothetical protein